MMSAREGRITVRVVDSSNLGGVRDSTEWVDYGLGRAFLKVFEVVGLVYR